MATLNRGLKNIYVAEVTKDDATGYITGTPFHLIPAGTMSRTTASDLARVYFDDAVFAQIGANAPTEITIEGARLSEVELSRILSGKDIDSATGGVFDSGDFSPRYFALGGETEDINGNSEHFWFYKGTFSEPDKNDKTIDDTTDTNGMTLVFSAIQTAHVFGTKRQKKFVINSETTNIKAGQNWFAQVVTPENKSTVCEAKIAPASYTLDIASTNASVTVIRDGEPLGNNATIYAGDALYVNATADVGYQLSTVTINGVTLDTIPTTYYVNGNTSIDAQATAE